MEGEKEILIYMLCNYSGRKDIENRKVREKIRRNEE